MMDSKIRQDDVQREAKSNPLELISIVQSNNKGVYSVAGSGGQVQHVRVSYIGRNASS